MQSETKYISSEGKGKLKISSERKAVWAEFETDSKRFSMKMSAGCRSPPVVNVENALSILQRH